MKKIFIILLIIIVIILAMAGLYFSDYIFCDSIYIDEAYEHTTQDSLVHLTVLVNFTNQQITTSESDWHDFYFGSGKSVADYFDDMSKGEFQLIPAKESYGIENNGIIEVSIDRKHPDISQESPERAYNVCSKIFDDVIDEIDEYIDFSQYDSNGDGMVLANEVTITMIAAGYESNEYTYGEKEMSDICIYEDYLLYIDGVSVGDYILCGELDMDVNGNSEMVTIGVACHETAHVLGLPDLYDADYSSIGLGFHSLMSEGNNNRIPGERLGTTPSPLTAWSREYVGFIESEEVNKSGTYTLYGQSLDNYNVIKIDDGAGYYLIENVDFNGYGAGIQEYMEHSGIAIWYIDDKVMTDNNIWNNIVNDDEKNRGVTLIEAAGKDDLFEETLDYYNPDYDHYFAAGYNDEYITDNGTVIRVLDAPGQVMDVQIEFN